MESWSLEYVEVREWIDLRDRPREGVGDHSRLVESLPISQHYRWL